MTLTDQYAAGILDGEGCIAAYSLRNGTSTDIRVSITGKYRPTLIEFRDRFGGTVRPTSTVGCFEWRIGRGGAIEECLITLLPYLREKRLQADEMVRGIRHNNRKSLPAVLKTLKRAA